MPLLKLTPLQSRFAATLGATLFLFALYILFFGPNFADAAETSWADPSALALPARDAPDDGLYSSSFDSPFQLGQYADAPQTAGMRDMPASELARRAPPGVPSLGNNQYEQSNINIGETQWWYFPRAAVTGKKSNIASGLPAFVPAGRLHDESLRHELKRRDDNIDDNDNNNNNSNSNNNGFDLSKRAATVYLSLTTCLRPDLNGSAAQQAQAVPNPPQLEMYVSTSAMLQKPGPGKDAALQTTHTADEGYVGVEVTADSDVFIGVTAPNSTGFTGIYNYQIAASIDAFFHSIEPDHPFLFFVDSDTSAALLVTNNLTEAMPGSANYKAWMDISPPPYTMFGSNFNDTSIAGLRRSYCGLQAFAQVSKQVNNVQAGMTVRGLGNKPKEQFYVTGLNGSSSYYGILAMDGNATRAGNGIVGGGGKVFKPMNFTTKQDSNCAVLFNLPFCSEVAYAVPANPALSVGQLTSIYDDYAAALYKNFSFSLQQIQCNASADSMFSLAVGCDDCAAAYKEWLCAVTIPRCYDFSSSFPYLQVRNAAQPFLNGSALPAADPLRYSPATNQSRNPAIDSQIKPGPYKEILPCRSICYDLVRKCPAALGFGCPSGKLLNSSYGHRDPNGDITCSYFGAAYYLSAGATVRAYLPWSLLIWAFCLILWIGVV